jgi:alkylation response protein AidB-like acyl-CoA dehydrogenase
VDFGLSEEQRLLEASLAKLLEEHAAPARVRAIQETAEGHDPQLWARLAEVGAAGLLVSEAHGGAGLALLDAALASQALGFAAAPAPFLGSGVMAPVALAAASPALRDEWLPELAEGHRRVAVAAREVWSRREAPGVSERGEALFGTSLFVVDGAHADAFLVATTEGSLALVPREASGVRAADLPTLDRTRRVAELVLDGARPTAWIGARGGAGSTISRMLAAGRVAVAADALGACDRALALSVAYAAERRQFGRPIASFQAVKHLCAEMAAELEPARSLLWYAAHAFDAMPEEAEAMAAHVAALLGDVARAVVRMATEVHGGVGFTEACDVQLFFKRAHLDAWLLGGSEALRAHAAALEGL